MMQFSSELISVGSEIQMKMNPEITYLTDAARIRFKPEQRFCYDEHDKELTHLNYKSGYRYSMQNCLIDNALKNISKSCNCRVGFSYPDLTGNACTGN